MSIELIHLRKLLQIFYMPVPRQKAILRAEIRSDRAKEEGKSVAGGDFYGPFWADVRDHVIGRTDLHSSVINRISNSAGRERLYPLLEKGFLDWWDDQRRWTNDPFVQVRSPNTILKFSDILSIKLDGFLAIQDASQVNRYIYPYFSETPVLKNEAARIGLWAFKKAFVALPVENFRILDVLRGRIFAIDRHYLEGDEQEVLERRSESLWQLWTELQNEMS